MNQDEDELERVLFRLSAIEDDARLEHVLSILLPKLLVRFESTSSALQSKSRQILVQIFNHISRWVKAPSTVKLPIVDMSSSLQSFGVESEALRVSLLFIEIGFSRSPHEEQRACARKLLDAKEKFKDSLPQFAKLLFSVLLEMEEIPFQHVAWTANLCVESCYDASPTAAIGMEFLLRSPALEHETLLAGILCSTLQGANNSTAARLGQEAVKKIRDLCDSRQGGNERLVLRLFEFVLERRTPAAARALALDLAARYCKTLSEPLCKVVISGLCGQNVPVPVRNATLHLLKETAPVFPQTGPLDLLLTNALQKPESFSSEERAAYLASLASWVRTRAGGGGGGNSTWKAKHCLALLEPEFAEEHALEPALHALLPKLAQTEIASLINSNTILRIAEDGRNPPQSFLLELATLARECNPVASVWIQLFQTKGEIPRDVANRIEFDGFYQFANQRCGGADAAFLPRVLRFMAVIIRKDSRFVDEFVTQHVAPILSATNVFVAEEQIFACECVLALLLAGNTRVLEYLEWDWLRLNLQSSNVVLRVAASRVAGKMFSRGQDDEAAAATAPGAKKEWRERMSKWIKSCITQTPYTYETGALLAAGEISSFDAEVALALEHWLLLEHEWSENIDIAFQSLTNLVTAGNEDREARDKLKNVQALAVRASKALKRSDKQGVVMFIGRVLQDYNQLLDEILLHGGGSDNNNSEIRIPMQIATGVALRGNAQALKRVLDFTEGEMSKRQRLSCAMVLEHMTKTESVGSSSSMEIQQGFLALLGGGGDADALLKLCACRGIAQNYLQTSEASIRERLIASLVRRFTVQTNLDRQLQELCLAATQAGSSSLVFYFFAIVGDLPNFPASEFAKLLEQAPMVRLATQFLRRRHVGEAHPLVQKVAQAIYPNAAAVKRALSNVDALQAVYQDASRLLQRSFVLVERKSALLVMVECLNHCGEFIAGPIETWRDVFRALDDLDDSISAYTSFGHAVKRITLKSKDMDEEEVFSFLLTTGLGSSVLKVRNLTRSFFMDSIASKRLPEQFAVRLIEALLRTIGESESLALQYAQFHTRGGAGTGELAVDAGRLEEIRCRLALESLEYAALLKCTDKVRDFDALFLAVARVLRTGVGLATLASAVAYVEFLSSEEGGSLARLHDKQGVLLHALTLLLLRDQSVELKRRILFAAGKLARLPSANPEAQLEYFAAISALYDADPEQSSENRLLAALACRQVVDCKDGAAAAAAMSIPMELLRPALLGRFDEDKQVAEAWLECWTEMRSALQQVSDTVLIQLAHGAINAYSYRQRRQGAQVLMSTPVLILAGAKHGELMDDLLKLVASGGNSWEGKEIAIKAMGHLLQFVEERALVQRASLVLETCLFSEPRLSKWTLQALFEAAGRLFANQQVKEDGILRTSMQSFVAKCEAEHEKQMDALVAVAMLGALREIVLRSQDEELLRRRIVALVLRSHFTKQASWNVKVASLQLFALAPREFTAWELVEQLLEEEKKPSVVLAALALVRSKGLGELSLYMRQLVTRLARDNDAAIAKAACELAS